MKCPKCGSRDIDFQESGGQSICVSCGTVLEENTIVSSIEFQESGDRSHVVGQFVSASCSKPYISGGRGMSRHGDSRDSRDATLVNARRAISQVAAGLRLPSLYIDRAYRLYQLALQRNFIFGRRQTHVVATCLYIICRQEKSPHLLIDFSDSLQVNVYVLGKSFLQFSKILNLSLPVVDPALYIHRYATRLDLGDKINTVITSALRIVSRLKKDWIATGRRPDGICAVAMLIGCRAHGFNVGQGVISKIFRISSETLKRRLDDFKATPSAQMTIAQFNVNDLEVEFDPPSFIRAVETASDKKEKGDESNSVYDSGSDLENDDVYTFANSQGLEGALDGAVAIAAAAAAQKEDSKASKSKLQARQSLYGQMYTSALSNKVADADQLRMESKGDQAGNRDKPPAKKPRMLNRYVLLVDPTQKLNSKAALVPAEVTVDEGENPFGEGELDKYFFNEEEQSKRAAIWEKNFRPFMDERQRRNQQKANETTEISEKYTLNGKLRKKYSKRNPVDENTTTSQAVLASTRPASKGSSKKINYDALKGVFAGDGSFAVPEAIGASSSSKSTHKVTAATIGGARATSAVKIVAGGIQNTTSSVRASVLKPDSEVVKSAISEKAPAPTSAGAASNAPADDYDEDEEMLMYDDVNDVDNEEYGYDDDEYY